MMPMLRSFSSMDTWPGGLPASTGTTHLAGGTLPPGPATLLGCLNGYQTVRGSSRFGEGRTRRRARPALCRPRQILGRRDELPQLEQCIPGTVQKTSDPGEDGVRIWTVELAILSAGGGIDSPGPFSS